MEPGLRAVCIREVQRSTAQSVKRLLEDKIGALGVGAFFEVQDKVIKSPGAGLIIFEGMQNHTADTIKSLEGYRVAWVEEAQSLSQHSLDILEPTIRAPGSEIWFSWNPRNATDPVDTFLRGDDPPPNSTVIRVNYDDNPWFPDEMRGRMEWMRRRDPDKYQHIYRGEYQRNSEARVFRNWREEEFETPPNVGRFYYGADWGFATDPTVLTRCYLDGRTIYVDQEAYRVGCKIADTPALFDQVPGSRKWPITADSARPETIAHMRDAGFNITPATKGAGSVEDGVEFLKSFDIVVHPRCRNTIDELTLYSYKTDRLTGEVLPVLEDKKNHVIDALRYALESTRRAPAAVMARKIRWN